MNNDQKRPRTLSELKSLLESQIAFLKRSADAYDNGFEDEAIRLAATIRVLLHDSKTSKSLLSQLNMKNIDFFDSATDYDPQNRLSHHGLVCISLGPSGSRYTAMLDDVPTKMRKVSFKEWWNKIIFADTQKRLLSRQKIILIAANQDGGAHIDPELNETYAAISKEGALGWMIEDQTKKRPLDWPERAAIRQIAHEVLKSLISGYEKRPKPTGLVIVGGVSLVTGYLPAQAKMHPLQRGHKTGRNEPCPCGSNKKFKQCHGKT